MALRTLVTYGVMMGFGYNWREKLFYALAWTPKATVQAALSGACAGAGVLGTWHVGGCRRGRTGQAALRAGPDAQL